MRRDKTVARILLIFSTTNVVFASPAVVPQSHLDVTKAASEKRAGSEDGTTSGTTVNLPPPESESHPLSPESQPESSSSSSSSSSSYDNPSAESGGHLSPRPRRPPLPPLPPRPLRVINIPSAAEHGGIKQKIIVGGLVTALVGSTAILAYAGTQIAKQLYVSLLSLVYV